MTSDTTGKFGQILRTCRKLTNLSQRQLAYEAFLSNTTISKIETSKIMPSRLIVRILFDVLLIKGCPDDMLEKFLDAFEEEAPLEKKQSTLKIQLIHKETLPRVFISYKWQDHLRNAWVESLYKDLRKMGVDAKLDKYEVAPGESFSDYMTREIRECDSVLFIITPEAVKSVEAGKGALAFEMQISNARRMANESKFTIIPIFREGKATSTYLSDHRYLDFRNDNKYKEQLEELVRWLYKEISPPPLKRRSREDGI